MTMPRSKQKFLPFDDTSHMVAESIEYLKKNEPPDGYFVGFSGGKDSICTAHLCALAGVKHQLYYSCTRIDPPEIVRFIKREYSETIFLYPKLTFLAGIKKKGPPLRMMRWCCDALKKVPGKDIPLKYRVMGIRAEESNRRAKRPREDPYGKTILIKPIFYWSEYHVWDFIETCGLKYPSIYDEGFDRIGCVICPFSMGKSKGKTEKRRISMGRWPGMWKAFRHACGAYYNEKRKGNRLMITKYVHDSFDEYYEAYLRGFE